MLAAIVSRDEHKHNSPLVAAVACVELPDRVVEAVAIKVIFPHQHTLAMSTATAFRDTEQHTKVKQ